MNRKQPTLMQLLFGRVRGRYRRQQLKVRIAAMGILLVLLLVVLVVVIAAARRNSAGKKTETAEENTEENLGERTITIGATGCVLLHQPFLNYYIDENWEYDFSDCFKYIKDDFSSLDYLTAEMEGSITDDANNYSAYPSFRAPSVIINDLKEAGVDLQLTATNHVFDGGEYGFDYMLRAYKEAGIPMIGITEEDNGKRYYIAEVDGIKIGYMNYTYGEQMDFNTIEIPDEYVNKINMFNEGNLDEFYRKVTEDIVGMKLQGAQFIVANLHWGDEYELEQNSIQEEIAQKFCELGVDALIGGHPHVVQPVDYLTDAATGNEMFVAYSVGNMLSNQMVTYMDETMPTGHTEDGVIVKMTLHADADNNVTLQDVDLLPTWCHREDVYSEEEDEYGDRVLERAYFYVLPLSDTSQIDNMLGVKGLNTHAEASYERTMDIMEDGLNKAKEALANKLLGE